ncbi:MAG: hypothetical protein K5683_12455 [Prevotella sp.]|nr:hypothetical protein [Prevotella sp.]
MEEVYTFYTFLFHVLFACVAKKMGTNRNYLSKYFTQQGMTYNAYINGLRVDHFMRLYQEHAASKSEFTARQLSVESGFHTYNTFINASF